MKTIFFSVVLTLLFISNFCFSQCPSASGLYTENYSFTSVSNAVEGHWESMVDTEVDHFMIKYKKLEDSEWNNLLANDSSATSKIIGGLEFNTFYHWGVVAYCSENQTDPAMISDLDTFLTISYVECPSATNLFVDNIVVNENQAFANGNWDSMLGLGVDHFILQFKLLEDNDSSWTLLSNMDSTYCERTMGNLDLNSTYEWRVRSYCSENQSYYSEWSVRDTFEIGEFVPQPFDPVVSLNLDNQICEGLSSLSISVSQTFNQPDIQFSSILSNSGSFEISSMQENDVIGEAYVNAGNGFIQNYYDLVVYEIINDDKVEIALENIETGFYDIYFDIENTENGIKVLINSPNDQNNYTSGNSIEITFDDIFRNPSPSLLEFYFSVSSDLNDSYNDQIDFLIECTSVNSNKINFKVFPNPVLTTLNIDLQGTKDVFLYNNLGKEVFNLKTNKNTIDFSNIADGLYLLKIRKENSVFTEKLIVR